MVPFSIKGSRDIFEALIDTGAFRYAFIDRYFISRLNLSITLLKIYRYFTSFDGSESSAYTGYYEFEFNIGRYYEKIKAFIVSLPKYPLLLDLS